MTASSIKVNINDFNNSAAEFPMLSWQLNSTDKENFTNPNARSTLNIDDFKMFPVKTRNKK